MAPKSLIRIIVLILMLAAAFSASYARVEAASSTDDPSPFKEHVIKFYLDPAIVPDTDFAKSVLPKYVADMNAILAKNTNRRLLFDPETDIIQTSTKPQTDSAHPPLPTEDFEIWAHVTMTDSPISYGGYAGIDISGAGVLAGLYWTRLYDPDNLSPGNDVLDYSIQIDHMLHELAHVFGAGIGEYYSLASITDTTGIAPLLNIDANDPDDAFWSDKPDFKADPLLHLTDAATRANYLEKVRYSNLTAAVMSGGYRNGVISFDHYTVRILDENEQPVPSADVKVWSIQATSPYTSQLLFDGQTDGNGQIALAWGGPADPHNTNDLLRLIKVYKDGVSLTQPKYVSIFDADIQKLVYEKDSFTVTMTAADNPPTDILLSGTGIDENQPIGTLVGTLSNNDPDPDTFTYSLINGGAACPGTDNTSFQISGGSLQSAVVFDSETKSSYDICIRVDDGRSGTFDKAFTVAINNLPDTETLSDVPTSYWAWQYIESIYSAGITGGCGTSPLIYCPTAPVTRAQMAVFILRGMHGGSYVPAAATGAVFNDVPASYWAAGWIEQLYAEGITTGCGGGNYCPDSLITRDQMAAFLLRAKHGSSYVPPAASGAVFNDVPASYWAAGWIEQLATEGITSGCGPNQYCPDATVTRAEMAVFIQRAFNLPLP